MFASTLMALLIALGYLAQPKRFFVSGRYQPLKTERSNSESDNNSDLLEQLKFLDQFLDQYFRSDNDLSPEAKLIKDDEALQQTIQTLQIEDHEGNPASTRSLRRRVQLLALSQGNVVKISMYDPDPDKAKRIINQLMNLYVERFGLKSKAESVNFTSVLQPHLVNADTLVKQSKQAIYQIQLGSNQTPLAPIVKAGDQTLELQSIRISSQQQLSTIDPEISILQQELVIATNEKKSLLQSIIELSSIRKEVLVQLNDILERPKDDPQIGDRLNKLDNKILDLNKVLVIAQENYKTFLKQQKAPWAFNQGNQKTVNILQPAKINGQGKRPFLAWFIGLGAFASMGAGVLASLFSEDRKKTLRSLNDLYANLKLPIFGVVPHFSGKSLSIQALARHDGTEFQEFKNLSESYTQIIRRFEVASLKRIPQVMVFTSANVNEGKSLTVANLSYILAKQGKKILLLEADLFRPNQNQYWGKNQSVGLCECIAGEVQLGKALQRLHPNLDLLQCGRTHKNKNVLLNSPGVTLLIRELRSRYNHILIDAPALSDSVHGYLMANCADVTLFVLRPKNLNYTHIFNLKETLERTDQRLWGMIVNDSTQNSKSPRIRKLIQESQWDANIRLQKQLLGHPLEISTLSAINKVEVAASDSFLVEAGTPHQTETESESRRAKQEAYLYQLPIEELQSLVNALWESWSNDIEVLLEQEEEVVQQSRLVRELQEQVDRGNPYLKLSIELQLKEEKEKLNLLADTYIGQRPNLIADREDLQFYLEILFARTDAECVPMT